MATLAVRRLYKPSFAVLFKRINKQCKPLQQLAKCSSGNVMTFEDPYEGAERKLVTLIPGDGVGPELVGAVKHVFSSVGVPVDWDEVHVSDIGSYGGETSLERVLQSIQQAGIGLKGALTTPSSISNHHLSLNQNLRLKLDLFANVVHCKSVPGIKTRHDDIDIVVIRENTEGEYTSLEHESVPGVIEMIKVITRTKSERIAKFAFDYAMKHKRKKVTCVHKANIMKQADGLFFDTCQKISELYPKIEFEGMIVDNTCMQLVSKPQQFDVMVLPNLYGSIVDNVGAGLVGGAGVVPGTSFGRQYALFEPGARHTFAQVAGRNVANPTAMLLASCDMLEHIHFMKHARMIREAVLKTIAEGKYLTLDLGGSCSTSIFTNRVIQNVQPIS
ncbi:isocitrate dehydrogenase [NAD] subunit beta, mitochondrial-like [Hydractinia symbiolongicarpus]|uniref:isocitrate dehydrogenase [NAD] subunit beta, mitochondrial-like n=1 Tax=Hydractinia symbiolongicarpus TaxID=13093 RepID=UPI00254C926C|nr:isocitrate dehydrogenase [NAD] subunit beta, mitochondrial-like [Hydractinia symbiolongicarpus]